MGGVDLQLLGLGHDGHIGFNEPNDEFDKETHCVDLTEMTIEANKRFFNSIDEVPRQAYTMGIATIMRAKCVLMVVSGKDKAEILKKSFFGPITPQVPASILQLHPNFVLIADEDALSCTLMHSVLKMITGSKSESRCRFACRRLSERLICQRRRQETMVLQSRRVWLQDSLVPAQLEVADGKIVNVYPFGTKTADVDYGNKRIVPGFIDVHTHGAYGFDTNDGEPEGLRDWMRRIPEEGVTSILPTTVTQMPEVLTKAVANVAKVVEEGYEGAEILGIHFEGPYLDMEYKGAQPPEAIAKPTVEQFKMYQEAAHGMIKYITMAPEHDRNLL